VVLRSYSAKDLKVVFFFQYNKQHIIPLEEVKLESLEDDGRKYFKSCPVVLLLV
jgi:hypothetical protein